MIYVIHQVYVSQIAGGILERITNELKEAKISKGKHYRQCLFTWVGKMFAYSEAGVSELSPGHSLEPNIKLVPSCGWQGKPEGREHCPEGEK